MCLYGGLLRFICYSYANHINKRIKGEFNLPIKVNPVNFQAKAFLLHNLKKENRLYWGCPDMGWIREIADAWMNDATNSRLRYSLMQQYFDLQQGMKILDMAAGCGTFVFGGLKMGYEVFGIEPENWKHRFNALKSREFRYPPEWQSRILNSVGESLPFKNGCFDAVFTYQTLEHVRDVGACLAEMTRVLKPGGFLFLQFPDYRSFYEGHYRLPWLPLFPKALAAVYLKWMKRPLAGLQSLNYVTSRKIIKMVKIMAPESDITNHGEIEFSRRTERIAQRISMGKSTGLSRFLASIINTGYTRGVLLIQKLFKAEAQATLIVRKGGKQGKGFHS